MLRRLLQRELEGQLDVARNAIQVKDEECSQFKGMAESTSQQLSTAESEMQELKSQKEHQDADLQRERDRADGLEATARALEVGPPIPSVLVCSRQWLDGSRFNRNWFVD